MQRAVNHLRIQMTDRTGRDLVRRHAQRADPIGVNCRHQVTFDHAEPSVILDPIDGLFQHRSLTCAGGGHQVDHVYAMLFEMSMVVAGHLFIGFEDIGANHYLVHIASASSRSIYSTCISWPSTIVSVSPHRGQSRLKSFIGQSTGPQAPHSTRSRTVSTSSSASAASVPFLSAANENSSPSFPPPLNSPIFILFLSIFDPPCFRASLSAMSITLRTIEASCMTFHFADSF